MRKGNLLYLLLLLAVVFSCNACDNEDDEKSTTPIAMFLPNANNIERWGTDLQYLKSECDELGLKYECFLSDEPDNSNSQVTYLKSAIQEGAKYLIITAIDYPAIVSSGVLDDAKEKGCVVICHDRLIMNTSKVDYYYSCSLEASGILQASFIKAQYYQKSYNTMTIELLAGPTSDDNSTVFFSSAMDTIQPMLDASVWTVPSGKTTYEDVKVTAWTEDAGYQKMKSILDAYYPNGTYPDAILCPTDITAMGVIKALEEHHPNMTSYPIITAQDNSADARNYIKQGKLSMTLDKHIDEIAANTIAILNACMNDLSVPVDKTVNNGVKNIPSVFCSPVVVTANDID